MVVSETAAALGSNGTLQLLVVEDDEEDFLLLRHMLEHAFRHAKVEHVASVNRALARCDSVFYDLLFCDYRLGEQTGLELLHQLRSRDINAPVIFLTGQGDEEVAVQAMRGGAIDYLVKSKLTEQALGQAVSYAIALRKKEEALRKSEQEYRNLFQNANDAILIFEPETEIILEANPKACAIYGFTRDELIGMSLKRLTEDVPRGEHQISQLLERGAYLNFETVQLRKDGARIHILANSSVIDYRGRPAILSINRDITDLKHAEDELRKLFGAVEQSAEMILITDRQGVIEYVNPAFARLTGYTREEMVGQTPRLLKSGLQDVTCYERLWSTVLGGNVYRGVLVNKKKNGDLYYAEKTITPLRDASGQITHFVSNDRDITERHRAEAALRASEERYRLLFERNLAGVVRSSMEGTILECNDAFARAAVYASRQELLGLDITQFYWRPGERQALLQRLLTEKRALNCEIKMRRADGKTAHLLANVSLWDQPGSPPLLEATTIDVTERKQLQEQLLQAQKMDAVGQLAGGVAHDFNNLLLVISSYAELLADNLQPKDPQRHHLEEILKASRRAAALTRQLLAFSRKQIMLPRVLDLNSVLADTGRMLPRLIGEHIQVSVLPGAELWKIEADPVQIEQVILNLAVNARDAMPKGGVLTVETCNVRLGADYVRSHVGVTPGDYVLLAVSDTGIGIPSEIMPHIFEPFFTTKERGKGSGLGLPTVYGIVKQSGGFLWVYSEPDQGTAFKIYLPRCQRPAAAAPPETVAARSLRGSETILLVEDEDPVREPTVEFLARNGYNVLQARNGADALQLAAGFDGPIHMLITDVVMPCLGGRELAERLRKYRPETKLLFISGYTDATVLQRGVDSIGCFLQKPFSLSDLARKVRELLEANSDESVTVAAQHL